MSLLDITALLLTLSVLFGYFNHKWLKMPHTIGIVVISLFASGSIVLADWFFSGLEIGQTVRTALKGIDFHEALMNGFLSALLFAGAIHIDLEELASRKWAISLMATLGILVSTFLIASIMWASSGLLGVNLPFIWWLVFGALISPTDPVAVLGILKTVHVPPLLKAKIAGESLFNDGVGVVVFAVMLTIATGSGLGGDTITALDIAELFVVEALGGAILGLLAGGLAYAMMRSINDYILEVMITLALVAGAYALALHLHISGPIAMVVAGLLIGNHGARFAMSRKSRDSVFQFWELIDEILNSVLFLLIGLEVLIIVTHWQYAGIALFAVPVVLIARLTSVALPIGLLSLRRKFTEGAITLLTWGGLRGGISVALALSLPDNEYKPIILVATYAVVVFSIIVQGLTMQKLVKRTITEARAKDPAALKEDTD